MKTAKSYKLILLTITLILSVVACFMLTPTQKAFAAAPSVSDNPKSYFSTTGADLKYENDNVEVTVKDRDTFKFTNNVLVNDLGYEFIVGEEINSFELKFSTDSKYVNGNPKANDKGEVEYFTSIVHTLKITFNESDMTVEFNDKSQTQALSRNLKIVYTTNGNVLSVKVNDGDALSNDAGYYLVKNIGGTPVNGVILTFALEDGATAKFSVVSVDQKVSDATGAFKQTFAFENNKIKHFSYPRAILNDGIYNADGKVQITNGKQYTATVKAYSIFGTSFNNSMRLKLVTEDTTINTWYANNDYPKSFAVNKPAGFGVDNSIKLNVEYIVDLGLGTEQVWLSECFDVVLIEDAEEAPKYNFDEMAKRSFEKKLLENTKVTDENGVETFVRLGDKLTIPSMKDLLSVSGTSYEYLKYTVYYMSPSTSLSSTSKLEIPIGKAGDYKFFVIFEDEFGNKLENEDFFTTDEHDENKIIRGEFYDYIFSFRIEDDAPLSVKAKEQGEGFVNSKYIASAFDIEAHGYKTTYTLYYNANIDAKADDDGWVEIIKKSALKDTYESDVFTADEIKKIAYDGEVTFTPSRIGSYKIVCSATSTNTSRTAEDSTIIRVLSEAVEYQTGNTFTEWFNQNVWSVVFLSIGAICLVAIFVLLLVKPKEEN